MRPILRGPLCAGLALLTGCYSYALAPVAEVGPGTDVRVRVSESEARRLAEVLGREDRVLHGELVGREGAGLLLQVRGAGSRTNTALYQRVTLPASAVRELEVRRLDRWRTLGVAGVAVAGVAFAVLQLSGESETLGGEGPGADAVRIPLWTIR